MNIQHLERKAKEKIENQRGINYVIVILQNMLENDEIDFSSFSFDDLLEVEEILGEMVLEEMYDGELILYQGSPFLQILNLGQKIAAMERIPRKRATSPYLFI